MRISSSASRREYTDVKDRFKRIEELSGVGGFDWEKGLELSGVDKRRSIRRKEKERITINWIGDASLFLETRTLSSIKLEFRTFLVGFFSFFTKKQFLKQTFIDAGSHHAFTPCFLPLCKARSATYDATHPTSFNENVYSVHVIDFVLVIAVGR